MEIYRNKEAKPFSLKNFTWLFIVIGIAAAIGIYLFVVFIMPDNSETKPWNRPAACSKLYSQDETEMILSNNELLVRQIEQAGGNYIYVSKRGDCEGKGELVIMYGTADQAKEIRDIIGETFQGLPYRLISS